VQTRLRRPGIRIAGYALAIVGITLITGAAQSHLTSSASAAAGIAAFLMLMILFFAALRLIVPPRYMTNPRFQRFDIALGSLSLASMVLVAMTAVLAVLAVDGQSPLPVEFVAAAVIAGIAAGGVNELARRSFPDAWIPTAAKAQTAASQAATRGNVTIRPTRFTRCFVAAFLGGLTVVAIVGTAQGGTVAGGIALAAFCLGFTALIFWMSAGCSDELVWFMWRTVDRTTLRSMDLSTRPGLAVDYGGLQLFDSNGVLALTVPSLFFADDDMRRLIEALALGMRPT